jgi:hypothetical protein
MLNLKCSLMLIIMNISLINCSSQEMKKRNLKVDKIKCINSNKEIINATVSSWIEEKTNPIILYEYSQKHDTLNGKWDLIVFEYKDDAGENIKCEAEFVRGTFTNLRVKLEAKGINMLVKGTKLNCVRWHRSPILPIVYETNCAKYSEKPVGFYIFEEETDVSSIATIKEQIEFKCNEVYICNESIISKEKFEEYAQNGLVKSFKSIFNEEREKFIKNFDVKFNNSDLINLVFLKTDEELLPLMNTDKEHKKKN